MVIIAICPNSVRRPQKEGHHAEPGEQEPGEAAMSGQTPDVQAGPIDAGEGSNQSKQSQEPKHPGPSDRGRQGDHVDPVTAQVGEPASGGQDAAAEFEEEDTGQDELGRRDLRALTGLQLSTTKPSATYKTASAAIASSQATSWVTNQRLNLSRSDGCGAPGTGLRSVAIALRDREGLAGAGGVAVERARHFGCGGASLGARPNLPRPRNSAR